LGQLKSTLYARMEEVSFRSGVLLAAGHPAAGHPAAGHPAGQPDDEPRDRGRGPPAAIGGRHGRRTHWNRVFTALEPLHERTGTRLSLRQNALDPGFHGVPAWPGALRS
jgi:hypothetical protein